MASPRRDEGEPGVACLTDVPAAVFEVTVWPALSSEDRRSLRLVSRQARQLADALLATATVNVHDSDPGPLRDSEGAPRSRAAWQATLNSQSAFLARLPRLTSLGVHDWALEADLIHSLGALADATQRPRCVMTLSLSSRHEHLTAAGARAVSLACPQLRELRLAEDGDAAEPLALAGPVFWPLRHTTTMTQLWVGHNSRLPSQALRSVGHLSHLSHLHLSLGALHASDLHHLAARLPNLTHCCLTMRAAAAEVVLPACLLDVAPLFSLTQLTHLDLPVAHPNTSRAPPCAATVNALAQLGALTELRTLRLGGTFHADDTAFEVLRRLSQLTDVGLGRIRTTAHPGSGLWPLLQHLDLGAPLSPFHLLNTLQPLQPLRALMRVRSQQQECLSVSARLHTDPVGGGGGANQAGVLAQAARLLAHPQGLAVHTAAVHRLDDAEPHLHLLLQHVAAGLQPLWRHLTCLQLWQCKLPFANWAPLGQHLPFLARLQLHEGSTTDAALGAVPQQLPVLRELHVCDCAGVTLEGWLGLARACARPLTLAVRHAATSSCPADLEGQCWVVQEGMYGRGYFTWAHHSGLQDGPA